MQLTNKSLEHFSEFFNYDFLNIPERKYDNSLDTNKQDWIGDVHNPYGIKDYEDLFGERKANDLIILGDFIDYLSVSRFPKRSQKIPTPEYEFRKGFESLLKLSQKYNNIYLMMSNHDNRLDKYMYDNVPEKLIKFCHIGITKDLLNLIPNVRIVCQKNGREVSHIWQYKDVVFTHFEKSSIDIGKPVQEIDKYLHKWKEVYKLKPYNVIVQAHNHSSAYVRLGSKRLYQIPCLIDIDQVAFDYVFSGKPQGTPPVIGYIQAEFTNNKFDFNKSRIIEF